MISNLFQKASLAATLIAFTSAASYGQMADLDDVGKQMAIMLQNSHFARVPYDEKLSHRFLDNYLRDLDPARMYFTQDDINAFNAKFGDHLHELILRGDTVEPAMAIYDVFKKRVDDRVALTEKLLKDNSFDFNAPESTTLSRKDASWPKDDREAAEIWTREVKQSLLTEMLRRETMAKRAKEKDKPESTVDTRSAVEIISLRYTRFFADLKEVDEAEITGRFLKAVALAHDPHTDYMSAREMEEFGDAMKNELVGIGAQLRAEEDGAIKITGIIVGGPADAAGTLKANDRIIGVNSLNTGDPKDDIDIMFMKVSKASQLIRGKEGTWVALKIEPADSPPGETKTIVLQRGKVALKGAQASGEVIEMKTGKEAPRRIGVITLPSFYGSPGGDQVSCSVDVQRILERLIKEKIDGLVLDLRMNGGGYLDEVRRMTGLFINQGPVVQVKDGLGRISVQETDAGKPIYDGPMVVMTDKASASASEILAGALQDYNRAIVIGDSSTFGKGTVQTTLDISRMLPLFSVRNGAGTLKATIQKFYRPSGSSTQMDGVVPQIVLPGQLDAMEIGEQFMDYALPHDRIRPAAGFKAGDPQPLFLPKLQELSQARVKADKDFAYIIEDTLKVKERLKTNQVSLNKEAREKELVSEETLRDARKAEIRTRFAEVAAEDKKSLKLMKVTLDDLAKDEPLKEYDPNADNGDFIRAPQPLAGDPDETPKWPSGLDPIKRESIHVLGDLVDLTQAARAAAVVAKPAGAVN